MHTNDLPIAPSLAWYALWISSPWVALNFLQDKQFYSCDDKNNLNLSQCLNLVV